jgi:2-keto-3-deoxy-L-rhamnonate aldolase RhmA
MTRYDPRNSEAPMRSVVARLSAGEPVVQLGIRNARTPEIVRMASGAGYDLIWIDLEHSSMSVDTAAQLAAAATDLGMISWVRVPERDYGIIGRLLDCGASGIISPNVESAAEARVAAAACRFPPLGRRSALGILPQYGYARMPTAELTERANADVVLQVLLESAKAIENADEIAAVQGVDIIGIGTNDLTADLGCPGDVRDPRFLEACATVAAAAKRHGKVAVIGGIADPGQWRELLALGFAPLVFAGIDTDIIATALDQRASEWRQRFNL